MNESSNRKDFSTIDLRNPRARRAPVSCRRSTTLRIVMTPRPEIPTMGVFNLLEAYLALGLIVGISGLGVITMRNVVERRQETGALRALGFRTARVLQPY